jgi:DNA-binding response OmpR family regulator
MSGYADNLVLDVRVREEELDFLAKPLSTDTFLAKIREVLDRKRRHIVN